MHIKQTKYWGVALRRVLIFKVKPQNLKKFPTCFEVCLSSSVKTIFQIFDAFSEKLSFIYLKIFTNVVVSRICTVFIRPFCIIVDYSSTVCIIIVRLIRILPVVKLDECSRGFICKPCRKCDLKNDNLWQLESRKQIRIHLLLRSEFFNSSVLREENTVFPWLLSPLE